MMVKYFDYFFQLHQMKNISMAVVIQTTQLRTVHR